MGKLIEKGPNAGCISGRVGNFIFVAKGGKNFVRKLANKPVTGPSANQILAQQRFGFVQGFAKQFREIATIGYRAYGYAAFQKFNSRLFKALAQTAEGWQVAMEQLSLSTGALQVPLGLKCTYRDGRLTFKWQPGKKAKNQKMVLIWCEANGSNVRWLKVEDTGECSVDMIFHQVMYGYAFLTDEQLNDSSETVFLGAINREGGEK